MPGYRATVAIQSMSTGLYWRLVPAVMLPATPPPTCNPTFVPSVLSRSLVPLQQRHAALSCEASEESPLGRAHTA